MMPFDSCKLSKSTMTDLKLVMQEMTTKQADLNSQIATSGILELEAQIADLQVQLEEKRFKAGIVTLENELSELRTKYAAILQDVGQSIADWQPDRFSKGAKEIYVAEGLKILRSHRTIREIRAAELFEAFPFLAPKIAKCTLKDAEKHVSAGELEKYIERRISFSYEVV